MRLLKWVPWRFFATRIARAYGFLDPIPFMAKLRGFSHESEVAEPLELLRAGVLFHARGLINTKAIQNNLDWVWPYWVERQFNPADESFIPRAFSFSHINLTHRNWTAAGLPDVAFYPIVDPRGLITPLFDGWSIDFWVLPKNGERLVPSKLDDFEQEYELKPNLAVLSKCAANGWTLQHKVQLRLVDHRATCVVQAGVAGEGDGWLAVVLRPYNPEGISLVENIEWSKSERQWIINKEDCVVFDRDPERCIFSNYREGDVFHLLPSGEESTKIECPVSMASGALLFPLSAVRAKPLEITIPIQDELDHDKQPSYAAVPSWEEELETLSKLKVPDPLIQKLYDIAASVMLLHCPLEVYPGPYTYKRFWYRDAAFILNALITLGGKARARKALNLFPKHQTRDGYFLSQAGEWDSNGEAIWIMHRYLMLTRDATPEDWLESIDKGARWIGKKRLPKELDAPHAGLLPAGFSAEHLGPNDFYYWDDFWGVAGLKCAAHLLQSSSPDKARVYAAEAEDFMAAIVASFKKIPDRQARGAISASPHRRMDAGAVGSIVVDYPLQLFPAGEERVMKTVQFLMEHSSFEGGFFQNMIHSGINAYLTLHLAQVLLRGGDLRALELIDVVASLATSTGQWPEAIHPRTKGGCMGDGQHVWAAAEWLLMIRNLFVREEGGSLILCSGLFPRWIEAKEEMLFGPTLTPSGEVTVRIRPEGAGHIIEVIGKWHAAPPQFIVQWPGKTAKPIGENSWQVS